MAAKDWLAPVVVALVAFGGLWVVQPHLQFGGGSAAVYQETGGYAYAFPQAPRVADANASARLLLLSQEAQAVAPGSPWQSAHVGFQQSQRFTIACKTPWPCGPTHAVAQPGEPRLGVAGYNATRFTVHAFTADGTLVASNAPIEVRAQFLRGDRAEVLPQALWYLGANQTLPEGTSRLPSVAAPLLATLLPQLQGMPEGGVASTQTNRLNWLYGTLYVTVRLDALVHAP